MWHCTAYYLCVDVAIQHTQAYIPKLPEIFMTDFIKTTIKQRTLVQFVFISEYFNFHRFFNQSKITGKCLLFHYSKIRIDMQGEPILIP